MEQVRIEDESVVYEFEAERIAGPVSTRLDLRKRQRARWFDASLYRKADGSYIFVQASISTVWHMPGSEGHVRKPVTTVRDRLPDKVVYCGLAYLSREGREQCPAMTLEESRDWDNVPAEVVTEYPQYTVWSYPDHERVIRRLTVARHRGDGASSAAVSLPMRELLAQAAVNDPAFRGAVRIAM